MQVQFLPGAPFDSCSPPMSIFIVQAACSSFEEEQAMLFKLPEAELQAERHKAKLGIYPLGHVVEIPTDADAGWCGVTDGSDPPSIAVDDLSGCALLQRVGLREDTEDISPRIGTIDPRLHGILQRGVAVGRFWAMHAVEPDATHAVLAQSHLSHQLGLHSECEIGELLVCEQRTAA